MDTKKHIFPFFYYPILVLNTMFSRNSKAFFYTPEYVRIVFLFTFLFVALIKPGPALTW